MKSNFVRHKLKQGQPSIGSWLTLPDPFAARLMAATGFDWLTVELEHTPISLETAALMFSIASSAGVAPLVRIPVNSVENIKRVLDIGAWGIIVPQVNSRAEAEAVVEAARYFPEGNRSVGGQFHALNFGTDTGTYYEKANHEILVVVMLEHIRGVEKADEILSVPGIDACFIGPNDLHKSMGLAPTFDSQNECFVQAVTHVRQSAHKHKVASGIHVVDAANAQRRISEGFQFIAVASDAGFLAGKAKETATQLGLGGAGAAIKY